MQPVSRFSIHKVPKILQNNMVLSIPIVMLIGFTTGLLGGDVSALQKLVIPLTFLMVYPSMVGLNFKQVIAGGDTRLQLATQGLNFLVIPIIAFGLGLAFFPHNPTLRLGLFMTGLLPTSGMTLNWTNMAKGNLPGAVKMTVIGLVAGSILAPFYMKAFFGTAIEMPMSKTFFQIMVVVFVPMLLGFLTQRYLVKKHGNKIFTEQIKPRVAPWGTMGVLGVQFIAMALKAPDLVANPKLLLILGIPMFSLYVINFGLSTVLARFFHKRADGIAFIYGTALRNLSIALAIAMTVFGKKGSDVALLISFGFIFQAQMAAWHVKMIERLLPKDIDLITESTKNPLHYCPK